MHEYWYEYLKPKYGSKAKLWQQKFRSKKHNAFIKEFNKIALSAIDFKEIQLTDSRRRRN